MKYQTFEMLPNHIKVWLRDAIGAADMEEWSQHQIPALGNRTVLDVAGDPDRDKVIADYCGRVKGWFGGG